MPGSIEDEEEIDAENQEVDGALQHVGAPLTEGEHGDREHDQKQCDFGRREAEGDFLSGGKPNSQSRRNGQADGGQNRAEENVDLALQLVV